LAEADRIVAACKKNNVAFNWGAMRRHHNGYIRLREAIAGGDIGEPRYAVMYTYTDLIKHHPHTLDLVSMLLGDPVPNWVEGRLVERDESQQPSRSLPDYDSASQRFVPPPGEEIADPMVGFFRIGYESGAKGLFVPMSGRFDIDVHGTEGRVYAWDNGDVLRVRCGGRRDSMVEEKIIKPTGESPTVCTIRNIIREIETGERTAGNIDVTMKSVEAQFGIAYSHLQGGVRVSLPVTDRSLYIPGG
jgi:predicted dehydrogenase